MTASVVSPSRPVPTRPSGPSLPTQVGLEVRKSLSTRSGLALAGSALLIASAAMGIAAAAASKPLDDVTGPLVVTGMLTALVLLSVGVLSTAGEWTHGTVQTTHLLEPRRGRVLAAKAVAVALLGAALAAVGVGLAAGVLALAEPSASWAGGGRAIAVVALAGGAFALIGAGVGAALGNTPGALTGIYLLELGVLPVLQVFKPSLADSIDPGNAVLDLAQGAHTGQAITILAVWVGVALAAGTVMTRRRAIQ
jgi:ABC-2 type transport system permease protein